jgi:hypothetical protein
MNVVCIVQCSLDRLTDTLDEIDTDIIQYFVERLTEKLNEIDIDIIQ